MEIEFQISKEEHIDFYKLRLIELFQKRIVVISVFSFFVLWSLCSDHFTWTKCVLTIIVYIILVAATVYYVPLWIATVKFNKLISKHTILIEKKKYSITDEGLKGEGENYSVIKNWESIKSLGSNKRFIYIISIDKKVLVIPKRAFPTEVEAINFLGLIQSRNQKNTLTYTGFAPVQKPNYSLGFLCLIPLIGAFAGFIFMLQGIFKYKDKWFTIIGIGGIAFTIAFYGTLSYVTKNSKVVKDGIATVTKGQLKTLVKEIEYYKLEHNVYPDSLQQLNIKGEFINIYDPLLNDKENHLFNYQKIGNKYTLFSSGEDQIPNTEDDIYPSLTIDTSKVGLIINKK